jgi:hypothetical protein
VISRSPVLQAAIHTRIVLRPSATIDYAQLSETIYDNVNAALRAPASASGACVDLLRAARTLDPAATGGLSCPARRAAGGERP